MVKRGKFFPIFAVLTLLILLAPAVILAPGGNVAANAEDIVQEVTASFSFNETAPGAWNTFTAGSGGIQPPGLCLEQYTRDNVVRNTTLADCWFRNYTTGSGSVAGGGLDGALSLAWLTFNFNMTYSHTPLYNNYGTGAHFGFMVGRGHIGGNLTFVFVADFDSDNATMSNAVGKGFMLSMNETGTFAGHKIIGDFDIAKTDASYSGTFRLRNYAPNEVYDLGALNVTGGVLEEWTDPIHTPLALLDYMSDGPYITPINITTVFEEIAWGKDPIKTVTSGHLGVNGTMDLSRNTALYMELELMGGSVRIQGTTACNLFINDTYAVTGDDGSPYGDLYELLLLYIPDQQLPLGEFFYQNGYTFTPFGMLNPSTECYAGTEYYALAGVGIEAAVVNAKQWSVDHSYGLYPHPKVDSVTPGGGMPGATINVTIKGKYFLRAAGQKSGWVPNSGSVDFGPGITVNSYSFKNSSPIDNEILANITIAGDAATGSRDVTVTSCFGYSNGMGTAPYKSGHGVFNVTGPPTSESELGFYNPGGFPLPNDLHIVYSSDLIGNPEIFPTYPDDVPGSVTVVEMGSNSLTLGVDGEIGDPLPNYISVKQSGCGENFRVEQYWWTYNGDPQGPMVAVVYAQTYSGSSGTGEVEFEATIVVHKPAADVEVTSTENIVGGVNGVTISGSSGPGEGDTTITFSGKVEDAAKEAKLTALIDPPEEIIDYVLTILPPSAVGGVVELPGIEEPGAVTPDSSGHNYGALAGIIVGAIVGTITLISAVWYVRRRRTKAI